MLRILLALLVALTLAACQTTEPPPATEAETDPPVIIVIPDPNPHPIAPMSCPIIATVVPAHPVATFAPTVVTVRLGSPCAAGDVVPVTWREQQLHRIDDGPDSYVVIVEGILHTGSDLTFAIPRERRSHRYEVVDLRLGADARAVVLAVQNGRARQPW